MMKKSMSGISWHYDDINEKTTKYYIKATKKPKRKANKILI